MRLHWRVLLFCRMPGWHPTGRAGVEPGCSERCCRGILMLGRLACLRIAGRAGPLQPPKPWRAPWPLAPGTCSCTPNLCCPALTECLTIVIRAQSYPALLDCHWVPRLCHPLSFSRCGVCLNSCDAVPCSLSPSSSSSPAWRTPRSVRRILGSPPRRCPFLPIFPGLSSTNVLLPGGGTGGCSGATMVGTRSRRRLGASLPWP